MRTAPPVKLRACLVRMQAALPSAAWSLLVTRAEHSQKLLVATLLVGHALLDRLPTSRKHHLDRLDDEEEDGSCDRHELDQIGEKRSVVEDGSVDREGQVTEVGPADDRGDDGHHEVLDQRGDDRSKREAHDERNGELDDAAPEKEILELLDHG